MDCFLCNNGLLRELNPGPLAPEARIMPLDQAASAWHAYSWLLGCTLELPRARKQARQAQPSFFTTSVRRVLFCHMGHIEKYCDNSYKSCELARESALTGMSQVQLALALYHTRFAFTNLSSGPVAQWIRHRPTEPGIAGSSPAGVIFHVTPPKHWML